MASSSSSGIRLKLLIDKKSQKVLFAEATKEFVDFLFSLMSLPLGTVIGLLSKTSMVGCLGKLYQSIETLNQSFLQPTQNKESILNPRVPLCAADYQNPLLLSNNTEPLNRKAYYVCQNFNSQTYENGSYVYHRYVGKNLNSVCPDCNNKMSTKATYVAPPDPTEEVGSNEDGGFVKGVVTYMVMDDLEVKPMSAISSITFINKFNITDLGSLEEKEVDVGVNEGLMLLKESMQSINVLTKVFLKSSMIKI